VIKVLEIKGIKSLRAWNVFQQLMLGVSMLPEYSSEKPESFYKRVQEMSESDQEKVILKAINMVPVEVEDLQALFTFCADQNGVPFSHENIKNLKPVELIEMIFMVCKEIAKLKMYFVSEDEKKK
jgi:hypothetical protein